jgi:hypothetical protein
MQRKRPVHLQKQPTPNQNAAPASNPALAEAVLAKVDKQLATGQPPEVLATFERLVAAGHSAEGARQLIAHVVVQELFPALTSGKGYDHAQFLAALQRLPNLPGWDNE